MALKDKRLNGINPMIKNNTKDKNNQKGKDKDNEKDKAAKLEFWKKRLATNQERWDVFANKFDQREEVIKGKNSVSPCVNGDTKTQTPHVRNITDELIEAQVDTAIPMPKVTAVNEEDELLAKNIEDMLISELDNLPMEVINDMMERTVPIQGGAFILLEWDDSIRTQTTVGDMTAQYIHPKQIVPQDGVFESIEDMDFIILKVPQTKAYINHKYGVNVSGEDESEPNIRSAGSEDAASGLVTQYIGYYRNNQGGIGRYSWVNDIQLEDIEDYQARVVSRCEDCGSIVTGFESDFDMTDESGEGTKTDETEQSMTSADESETGKKTDKKVCPYCGSTKITEDDEGFETLINPYTTKHGKEIPSNVPIPYYKPDVYPIILQKSVSIFGQLLGDSDVDKIKSQQNTTNRLAAKMLDKILRCGSFATLPPEASIILDNDEMKYIRLNDIAQKQMIDVFDMEGDIKQDLELYCQAYEEARQIIGITDSFQGRRDTTATSGKAKEFAAKQTAGRLESKRVMKEAAYQQLYEILFKFKLAYTDEPRPLRRSTPDGQTSYDIFDRYDFLKQDDAGQYYWEDRFIFSVDTVTPLSKDREALWQETRMNLETGAFGNPDNIDTLILFWSRMEKYHYPGADDVKKYLDSVKSNQIMQQQAMQQQEEVDMANRAAAEAEAAEAKATMDILKGGNQNNGSNQKAEEENPIKQDRKNY